MQKLIQRLPIIVVISAFCMTVCFFIESRQVKKRVNSEITGAEKVSAGQLPISQKLPEKDRQLVARVFDAPEKLDAVEAVSRSNIQGVEPVCHPPLMSKTADGGATRIEIQPPETNTPYFHKDFESLRTDAVSNPDSVQNRTTVTALMQMRQRRLEQK